MADLGKVQARLAAQVRGMLEMAADDRLLTTRAEEVSHWSVALQLEHLAITDLQVLAVLRKLRDQPDRDARQRAHPLGLLMMAINWIPRGMAKAPELAQPKGVDPERLRTQLGEALAGLETMRDDLPALARARGRFRHPKLGWLDAGQWLRFVRAHHHHHLKIVRDIRRAAG